MTDINKQIEIAESIVIRLKKENYEKNQSFNSGICQDFKCKDCPAVRIYHNDISCIDRRDTLEWFENWLSQNKPQPKMTKEELIERCKGKVFKCESKREMSKSYELAAKHGFEYKYEVSYPSYTYFAMSNLCDTFYLCGSGANDGEILTAKTFLSWFEEPTEKPKPDFEPHTEWTRLDKILENIESLEKQKMVIEERIVESEKQLLCKLNDELLCEYVASDASFNITTEGSRLENIHLVRDFIDSLIKVEEV